MKRQGSLFKQKPLPWAKSTVESAEGIKEESVYDNLYQTKWIKMSTDIPKVETNAGDHLLLSRMFLDDAQVQGWTSVVINGTTTDAVLDEILADKAWVSVCFLSSGMESDVSVGLKIVQRINVLEKSNAPQHICFLTYTAQVDDGGLWGLARTARLEYPECKIRCIETSHQNLELALRLSLQDSRENEYKILPDGSILVPRLERSAPKEGKGLPIRAGETYLISGGTGGLGIVAAQFLIEQGASNIVLLARTAYTESTLPADVLSLRENANVLYCACDIANLSSVEQVKHDLKAVGYPEVKGIIHTAGVLTDGVFGNQSPEKLQQAMSAKVQGAKNLREVFKPTSFLLLYSSVASVFGSVAQASYAAANATLDAMAEQWSKSGENVLSIQWGVWADAGMALRNDAAKRAEQYGFGAISNDLGKQVLKQLLAARFTGKVCVSPINWKQITIDNQFVSDIKPAVESKPQAKAVKSEDIQEQIRKIVWDSFGEFINDEDALLDNGLDSLGSTSLRNRLASTFKVELPSAFVVEYPTIKSITNYITALIPKSPTDKTEEVAQSELPVLVIGAGVGGLSFARSLKKAGTKVVIMERKPQVGGVWDWLANDDSKLQIDSPSYDFDSTVLPLPGDHRWKEIFPKRAQILNDSQNLATEFADDLYLGSEVVKVQKVQEQHYEVSYKQNDALKTLLVSGVAAMTGGLHSPKQFSFPDEALFAGHIGHGISNDTPVDKFKDANVVIIGHGAFAIENMRTALENGAKHVTILCRKRSLVLSTFCNWLLNSSKGTMPINDVVDIMRPFYKACGMNIESLPSLVRNEAGELLLNQTTVPPGSDIFFLAQILGKLKVVEGEIASMAGDTIVTTQGEEIKANMLLKCLGFNTDKALITRIFGEGSEITGLWINSDPNLMTYNDGAQVPRKVKTLLCSSFIFFVKTFANAYIHFRNHPTKFDQAIARITADPNNKVNTEQIFVELWDFIEPAKKIVAERTLEICPFDRFQVHRESEWNRYAKMLGATKADMASIWEIISPALAIYHERNLNLPFEKRIYHESFGSIAVHVPRRQRVLFLSGQGTNARLARTLLDRTNWIKRNDLEFVIPDAPYVMPAFTNDIQLNKLGLDHLVETGLYDKNAEYREWKAGFETLWNEFHGSLPAPTTQTEIDTWERTLDYVKYLAETYGPFDGIAGFCEGATVASVALQLQATGQDMGLENIRFFIAMSAWLSPLHLREGLFNASSTLDIPLLHIVGNNDMPVFLAAEQGFKKSFNHAFEYRHSGQHVYPTFTPKLENELNKLLRLSNKKSMRANALLV